MARPSKFTEQQIKVMRKLRREGARLTTIAQAFDTSVPVVIYWTDDEYRTEKNARDIRQYHERTHRAAPAPGVVSLSEPAPAPARSKYLEWLERWQAA